MNGNISQEGGKCPNSQNEHSKCLRQAQGQQRCCCGFTVSYTSRVYDAFFFFFLILASLVAQTVKRLPAMREPRLDPWVGKIPGRRKWQSTPVFLPGKSHGWRSLVGYSPCGHKESDTIERLHFHIIIIILESTMVPM